jgi:hypothetical protein
MSDFSLSYTGEIFACTPYNEYDSDITHNANLVDVNYTFSGGTLTKTQFTDLFEDNETAGTTSLIASLKTLLNGRLIPEHVGMRLLALYNTDNSTTFDKINYNVDLTLFRQALVDCTIDNLEGKWVAGKIFQLVFSFKPTGKTQIYKIGVNYRFEA